MYQKSRHFLDCHIAGFRYHDGLEVIDELKLGTVVTLASEPDNPHDPNAVAIYLKDNKLGYVPKEKNAQLSSLLYFGHADVFETRISLVNHEADPERQFRVVVKIKNKRNN
jgi:hypothetical protein